MTTITTSFDLKISELIQNTGLTPTDYQKAIYHWFSESEGNLIVNAVAGSGKTRTIVDSLNFIPPEKRITIVAYNKHIADELNSRKLTDNATACTLHSLGFGVVRKNVRGKVNLDNAKTENIARWLMAGRSDRPLSIDREDRLRRLMPAVRGMIARYKSIGHSVIRDAANESEIRDIADKYEVELPDSDDWDSFVNLLTDTYDVSLKETATIDFDDMILLPLAHHWSIPTSDFALVDESQDLNPCPDRFRQANDPPKWQGGILWRQGTKHLRISRCRSRSDGYRQV